MTVRISARLKWLLISIAVLVVGVLIASTMGEKPTVIGVVGVMLAFVGGVTAALQTVAYAVDEIDKEEGDD